MKDIGLDFHNIQKWNERMFIQDVKIKTTAAAAQCLFVHFLNETAVIEFALPLITKNPHRVSD